MKIVWIIDNKFRELYGLYDLKKNLSNYNIKLYLFHIPVWKTAIDLINPNVVVVPNLYKTSCEPIVRYAEKKKSTFLCILRKECIIQTKFKVQNIQCNLLKR